MKYSNKGLLKGRIVWIDWAKSLCMFLVILGHCHIQASEHFVTQYIYSFHMMFFFFISGMLCKRELSVASLKKDLQYIILPYFTYGLIYILFGIVRQKAIDLEWLLFQLKSLCVGDDVAIGPIWFLPALFICKQLFLMVKMTKVYNRVLYVVICVFSFFPAYFISKYSVNLPLFADSALCGLPFFIAGNEGYDLMNRLRRLKWYSMLCISVVMFAVSVILCYYNGFVSLACCTVGQSVFAYYIGAFSAIILICLICMVMDNCRWSFVAITAYGTVVILGLHGMFLTVLNYYLPLFLGNEPSDYPVYLALLYSVITFFLCYGLILIIDKWCPFPFGLRGH